ncbi:putative sulfate permease [Phaeomoniella chlamydospora]|uniref:Putative sulfate permease n=1 Tax=Phaeomoniella chlamydospora TaxID=158046 RepID=A0A0G2GPN6_PHACM|nr:putative sulfate permease [Phaeomoniella chlamydospora]
MSTGTKIGHGLAKVLRINLNYRKDADPVTRGESTFSIETADTYVEDEPSTFDWFREITPTGGDLARYVYSLFPFLHWIGRYNLQWLIGDLIAGITVGIVVVPQGMAYAKLAELPVQFGLYSSFMGVLIYWFFATSKDITIGPVAVLSKVTGDVVLKVTAAHPEYADDPHVIASALAIIAGAIVSFLGLARLGRIVDFIPLPAICAFMTGSAINIAVGQVPTMMGISGFDTRAATYTVVINILKHLGRTKLDAAMGLTALFTLYAIRGACSYAAKKFPRRAKLFFFLSTLRTAFVILLYVLVSWLVNRNHKKHPSFKILKTVPRGFQNAAVPTINTDIISAFASELPSTVIVMLIEHIAISKSFGRVNNYTINPSQEMVAIGVTNLLAPFLGGYPATGSFSRTAIKSKAGVRTPFAGVITAIIVLLAIYALPAAFYYIPSASLSAVIIHAVGDLITPPNTVYQFWKVSPIEVPIFFAGVIVTIFSTIENGIYTTICVSAAILLWRLLYAKGRFLGQVQVHSVVGDHLISEQPKSDTTDPAVIRSTPGQTAPSGESYNSERATRNIFLPINHNDGTNPEIKITHPYPGVFIYRFSEGFNYPNANPYFDDLTATVFRECRRTNANHYPTLGDRPWNDPGPRRGKVAEDRSHLPTLKAIVLDFSSVNNVDLTSVQHLIDVRNQLDRYTAPEKVQWHLACINNRWAKRALASAGFGFPTPNDPSLEFHRWKPIFSVADIGGANSAAAAAEARENAHLHRNTRDSERGEGGDAHADAIGSETSSASGTDATKLQQELGSSKAYGHHQTSKVAAIHGINRPLFHTDLTSAVQSAIVNAEGREAFSSKKIDE